MFNRPRLTLTHGTDIPHLIGLGFGMALRVGRSEYRYGMGYGITDGELEREDAVRLLTELRESACAHYPVHKEPIVALWAKAERRLLRKMGLAGGGFLSRAFAQFGPFSRLRN